MSDATAGGRLDHSDIEVLQWTLSSPAVDEEAAVKVQPSNGEIKEMEERKVQKESLQEPSQGILPPREKGEAQTIHEEAPSKKGGSGKR